MERRRFKGKDVLKVDGLLPPTKRAAHAESVETDKKKDKRWSLANLLKKISPIKDYESSSNEDDIVFCKRQPKNRASVDRTDGITLRPVQRNTHKKTSSICCENNRDSRGFHKEPRYSDGSLDGAEKKPRKSKVKARVEAKRDRLCAETSSDEDSKKSSSSLSKFQNEDCTQYCQKNNVYHRKTRTARTERYMKRFSKDDTVSVNDSFPIEVTKNSDRFPLHPSNCFSASGNIPSEELEYDNTTYEEPYNLKSRKSAENNIREKFTIDNENHYGKIRRNNFPISTVSCTTSPTKLSPDGFLASKTITKNSAPPIPPPRDPRCRIFNYSCHSFPIHGKHRHDRSTLGDNNNEILRKSGNSPSHKSNNEVSEQNDACRRYSTRPISLNSSLTKFSGVQETHFTNETPESSPWKMISTPTKMEKAERSSPCLEKTPRSSTAGSIESPGDIFSRNYITPPDNRASNPWQFNPYYVESEAAKCRRRNDRNNRLNSHNESTDNASVKRIISDTQNKLTSATTTSKPINKHRVHYGSHGSVDDDARPSSETNFHATPENVDAKNVEDSKSTPNMENGLQTSKEIADRRRSSKNLEEALSELEAIYNSLRLGDEELLDRAERRSMQEFSLKRGVITEDHVTRENSELSPDRSKDDMAYRRMHPKERPSSLSDSVGPLSSISYLMASPITSRKECPEYFRFPSSHKDEPDVMLDDVVFRSITRANKTLKVVEPQPPFGIPIGPISAAPESDYLHTTPRSDRPRSPFASQCEPDVVMDDLAFRTLRKDAGATKSVVKCQQDLLRSPASSSSRSPSVLGTVDQQPPFGIPIGPVVVAPDTDYLHVSPSKPEQPRSPYLPQHEPDVITDDLAYRTLRKDTGATKIAVKCRNEACKSPESNRDCVASPLRSPATSCRSPLPTRNGNVKAQSSTVSLKSPAISDYSPQWTAGEDFSDLAKKDAKVEEMPSEDNDSSRNLGTVHFATKKKRAVRSLSANLYGLINQDRIHLHREPNLEKMNKFMDSFNSARLADCREYRRRVVSDGELSDQDYNWKTSNKNGKYTREEVGHGFDVNGNQPTFVCEKKLQVYVSPMNAQNSERSQESDSSAPTSTSTKTLEEEFWRDRRRSDSNESPTSKTSDKSIESDLTTYSQLCQNLADIIKWSDDIMDDSKEIVDEECKAPSSKVLEAKDASLNMFKADRNLEDYDTKRSSAAALVKNGDGAAEAKEKDLESTTLRTESLERLYSELDAEAPQVLVNQTNLEDSLDYYLRLADENVKLIAEAFSGVADCLSTEHSCQTDSAKRSGATNNGFGIEKDYELRGKGADDFFKVEDKEECNLISFESKESTSVSSKDPITTKVSSTFTAEVDTDINSVINAETELSRVVRDLQIVAANLSDSKENDLKNHDIQTVPKINPDARLASAFYEDDAIIVSEEKDKKDDEPSIFEKNVEIMEDVETYEDKYLNSEHEVNREERVARISTDNVSSTANEAVLESTKQTDDSNGEETTPSSNVKKGTIKRDSVVSSEGENIVCELDAKLCVVDGADSKEECVPHMTNITSITAYTAIIFACLVALLLAIFNVS